MKLNENGVEQDPARSERAIRRDQLAQTIRSLGGYVPESTGDNPSDIELSFLAHVVAWETGTVSTHGEWLARRGFVFPPLDKIPANELTAELWRLIGALAVARVFLHHTDHLSDARLYLRLCDEVLPGDAPDFVRTADAACSHDFADAGAGEERLWLEYYATEEERRLWATEFRVVLPPRKRPPYARDHRLPTSA